MTYAVGDVPKHRDAAGLADRGESSDDEGRGQRYAEVIRRLKR